LWVVQVEIEENVNDNGDDIVQSTRKPGRPPKGVVKVKKTTKEVQSKKLQ